MIENFDEVKRQLTELADVINNYKSEAVQLRIVELVFGGMSSEQPMADAASESQSSPARKSRKARKPKGKANSEKKGASRSSSRPGPTSTLKTLVDDGFFNKPKVLGDIITHTETNMALKYKQSDFSGPLGRFVRDGILKRSKNESNQYEYVVS